MLPRILRWAAAFACCVAVLAVAGCTCPEDQVVAQAPPPRPEPVVVPQDLPPDAKPGECFAKVFVPPEFKTVSERVCVREASERLEIIPAEYEWVEERVCIKDASTQLVEVPARFATETTVVQTDAGFTGWTVNKDCLPPRDQPTRDVFCLVNHPPKTESVCVTRMVEPPRVKEEIIPAQYETVRRQKLVRPATTRRVCIPAEYETVEKHVKVADGRMVWQRVQCRMPEAVTLNIDGRLELRNLPPDVDE